MAFLLGGRSLLRGCPAASHQLRAFSSSKKGYWLGNFTPKDGADMDEFAVKYTAPMIASFEPFGGKMVVVAPKASTAYYHGALGAVNWVAEFPTVAAAQDWHASKAYQDLIPYRDEMIDASYIITEGTGA